MNVVTGTHTDRAILSALARPAGKINYRDNDTSSTTSSALCLQKFDQ
jgi:hypothetical protein